MKVLYIGHYKEGTGWSHAAHGLISAMDNVGIDVVCRNVQISEPKEVPDRILQLEKKDTQNVDFCIQHVLPNFMVGTDRFKKNIAYTVWETESLANHKWLNYVNLMDEIWVPCEDNKQSLINAGIQNVYKVPHAFDTLKYSLSDINSTDLDLTPYSNEDTYIFYTITDLSTKKNIASLLTTYYSTFERHENTLLILKVTQSRMSTMDIYKAVQDISTEIKHKLSLYENLDDYPETLVIANRMSEEEMVSIHRQSHCFVNMSRGEAWSIPSFDAMCFGKHPICANWGGPKEYITNDKDTGTLINTIDEFCSTKDRPINGIYTGKESWKSLNQIDTSRAMRYYYDQGVEHQSSVGKKQGQKFKLSNVGNIIKERLEQ